MKERYAFLYRPGKVQVLGPKRLYPDPDDAFIREPFWASFRAGEFDFTLVPIHSIFGDSKRERRAEALRLDDIYQRVQGADPDEQDNVERSLCCYPYPKARITGASNGWAR